jgi:hypothetical protein
VLFRSNAIAKDVTIEVMTTDQDGNVQYTSENNVIGALVPGDLVVHEISITYTVYVKHLDLNITVKWDGGQNQYTRSFTPKLLI